MNCKDLEATARYNKSSIALMFNNSGNKARCGDDVRMKVKGKPHLNIRRRQVESYNRVGVL